MNKNEKLIFEGKPYFHPGSLLKEILQSRHIEQKELSKRTNICEKHLSQLFSSQVKLTVDIAQKISLALGENPETWINMQSQYDLIEARISCAEELSKHVRVLKDFPIKDMEKYRLIKTCKEKWKKLLYLMSFLGFGDPKNVQNLKMVRYRKLKTTDTLEATTVLITWGKKIALSQTITHPYSKVACELAIHNIREYMQNPLNDDLLIKIRQELEKAGIIFVFTPKIKNTSVSGVSYKLNQHPVIHLTDRNKQVDTFWFSLFHELKHVVDDDISEIDKTEEEIDKTEEIENKANEYAKEIIIPSQKWNLFVGMSTGKPISPIVIQKFSNSLRVPNSCVIGRLQKEKIIPYQCKEAYKLREKNMIHSFDGITF